MFDDLNQQNNSNSSNQFGQKLAQAPAPKEAIDMFAETEPVMEKPAQFRPVSNNINDVYPESESSAGNMQKIFFLVITIFGFCLLGMGAYFGFKYFANKNVIVQEDKQVENKSVVNSTTTMPVVTQNPVIVDADKDGLSDTEEEQLGLNVNSVDTDNDGLFDREEVKIYKTDPKNFDTDADGMSDGDEVKVKRNPIGDGTLFGTVSTTTPAQTSPETTPVTTNIVSGSITSSSTGEQKTEAQKVGIDSNLDSDSDGLTDVDEVNKYKTNPKNSDTDGDGYSDGVEVKGGYNPNGTGKLVL